MFYTAKHSCFSLALYHSRVSFFFFWSKFPREVSGHPFWSYWEGNIDISFCCIWNCYGKDPNTFVSELFFLRMTKESWHFPPVLWYRQWGATGLFIERRRSAVILRCVLTGNDPEQLIIVICRSLKHDLIRCRCVLKDDIFRGVIVCQMALLAISTFFVATVMNVIRAVAVKGYVHLRIHYCETSCCLAGEGLFAGQLLKFGILNVLRALGTLPLGKELRFSER